jgi:hypothetical protein
MYGEGLSFSLGRSPTAVGGLLSGLKVSLCDIYLKKRKTALEGLLMR